MNFAIIHNHPIHYKHLLFTAMAELGDDFEVLFVSDRSKIRIEPNLLQNLRYRFRAGYAGPYENHRKIATIRFVLRTLNELNPNVVIISGYYDVAGWTAWSWGILRRRPLILWNETNSFDRPRVWYKEMLKRLYLRKISCAHVYGDSNREYLVALGLPFDRIVVKRAVADTSLFRLMPAELNRVGAIRFLFVGRLAPEKNLDFLIRAVALAVAECGRDALRLEIVGYGPDEVKLKSIVAELGLADIVHFTGGLVQQELPQRYATADVFVLPSVSEPWGLVALEAMLCGLPALVSTRCGCQRDLVTEETGWAFDPFNLPQLVDRLMMISRMKRPALVEMGVAASKLGSTYSPENCASIVMSTVRCWGSC
jgi:glycosyltransferase involved in cell wall biosynthesis